MCFPVSRKQLLKFKLRHLFHRKIKAWKVLAQDPIGDTPEPFEYRGPVKGARWTEGWNRLKPLYDVLDWKPKFDRLVDHGYGRVSKVANEGLYVYLTAEEAWDALGCIYEPHLPMVVREVECNPRNVCRVSKDGRSATFTKVWLPGFEPTPFKG